MFSLLDVFWVFEDIFAFTTIVPVVITLGGFIIIKLSALVLSWVYPEIYIKLNRKLNWIDLYNNIIYIYSKV